MRKAALASISIHLGLIAGAWGLLQFAPADDIGAESVSVDIISMDAVSIEPSEMVTETNRTLVSTGSEFESMAVPETERVEAVEVAEPPKIEVTRPVELPVTETVKATETKPAKTKAAAADPVAPTEEIESAQVMTAAVAETVSPVAGAIPDLVDAAVVAESVAPSDSDPLAAVRAASIGDLMPEPPIQKVPTALEPIEAEQPVETATLAPVIEEAADGVPVPEPRIVREAVEPEVRPIEEPAKKAETPKRQTPAKQQPKARAPSKQSSLGNGGAADADTSASKKSGGGAGKKDDGGTAAASKYPGLVQARVTRAAKYPAKAKGKGGEALVSFTVAAGGSVTRVALARSSGNAALDDAAVAAVNRAAPFPPIPAAAGRSSWSFTVPVYFQK